SGKTITFHDVHGFTQGQKVTYSTGLGTAAPIAGLTNGGIYFVLVIDSKTIMLCPSASQLDSAHAITLGAGSAQGHAHTLTTTSALTAAERSGVRLVAVS